MIKKYLYFLLIVISFSISSLYADEKKLKETPVLINADELIFNQDEDVLTARGNVEISQNNRVLLADSVSYNKKTDVISAKGNIVLFETTGEIIYADDMKLSGDFKDGLIKEIKILLQDESRLVGRVGRKTRVGDRTEIYKGIYSPCYLCKKNPKKAPIWQIKSAKVIKDNITKDIIYHDVTAEFFGIPFFYTPYFSHPAPEVKRRSGFLMPEFVSSNNLGQTIKVPYFITLGDSADMTLKPWLSTEHIFVMEGEYRKRFSSGEMSFSGSGTVTDRVDIGRKKDDTFRGHIDADGLFNLDKNFRTGFEIETHTDDTYRRKFEFGNESIFKNRVFLEGFFGKSYGLGQTIYFDNIRQNVVDDSPLILPLIEYQYVSQPDGWNGIWTFDTNFRGIYRSSSEGPKDARVSLKLNWEKPYISSLGYVATVGATAHADFYSIDNFVDFNGRPVNDVKRFFYPQAYFNVKYPFINQFENSYVTIEPIVGIVGAPKVNGREKVPNEDSFGFELDDTNIFDSYRLPGYDRQESGPRFFYGAETTLDLLDGRYASLFLGQSYNLVDDPILENTNVDENQLSDLVGRLYLHPSRYFNVSSRFQYDIENDEIDRTEVSSSFGPSFLKASVGYTYINDEIVGQGEETNQLNLGLTYNITDFWTFRAQSIKDFEEDFYPYHGISLGYKDECFGARLTFSRRDTTDLDFDKDDRILLELSFKNIGDLAYSTGVGNRGNKSKRDTLDTLD